MNRAATLLPEPSEAEIQHAAYYLWLEDGRPAGRDREHWFAAKEILRRRHHASRERFYHPSLLTGRGAGKN